MREICLLAAFHGYLQENTPGFDCIAVKFIIPYTRLYWFAPVCMWHKGECFCDPWRCEKKPYEALNHCVKRESGWHNCCFPQLWQKSNSVAAEQRVSLLKSLLPLFTALRSIMNLYQQQKCAPLSLGSCTLTTENCSHAILFFSKSDVRNPHKVCSELLRLYHSTMAGVW